MTEQPKGAYPAEVREWQRTLLNQVLRIVFIVAIPALLGASYYVWQDERAWLIPFYAIGLMIVGAVHFWKKAPYTLQVGALLMIVYGLAALSLVRAGLSSNVPLFLLGFCFIAALFLGRRMAFISIVVVVITMGIAGWLFATGAWVIPAEIQLITDKPAAWISYTATLLMVSVFIVMSQTYLLPRFAEALTRSREMAQTLMADREQAVHAAEAKHRHAEQLGWAANLGYVLASLRQRDDLVWRVVREIAQTFDIYQANLFLVARSGDVLSLAATSGALGETPAHREWDLRGAPGRAVQQGKEQMALPLPGELPHFPESRVEISLPLSVRGDVLGVLDIHTTRAAFSAEDLQIFRIIASQVSTALDMLRSLEELQTRTQELRALYAQQTLASWHSLIEATPVQSFTAGRMAGEAVAALAQEAVTERQPRSAWSEEAKSYLLVVPLVMHEMALGYLAFTRTAEKGDWDADARALIEMAAERLTAALDNARLLIEARQRVLYDERLGQLGDLIWKTPNPEIIMEQSVRELGRFLGASEVQLHLTLPGEARRGRGTQPLAPRNGHTGARDA